MSILLVDDDADCRLLTREGLLAAGIDCVVHEAARGAEAMDFLNGSTRIDMIFLDLEMPHSSGLDILAAARNLPKLAEVPIVILTGCPDLEHIDRAYRLGVNAYMIKPPDLGTYIHWITRAVNYWLCLSQRMAADLVG